MVNHNPSLLTKTILLIVEHNLQNTIRFVSENTENVFSVQLKKKKKVQVIEQITNYNFYGNGVCTKSAQ